MPTERPSSASPAASAPDKATPQRRPLSPAAERALAEAAARRAEREGKATTPPKGSGGPAGLDPTRYGDWEVKGLASDF
ncbi:MAG TPA: DUF1674 domain-containing protein [Xanthobacteraceae bacterium]|nr:DUF1674 domain-containing protein [Xanthobacteraceae bacterium]